MAAEHRRDADATSIRHADKRRPDNSGFFLRQLVVGHAEIHRQPVRQRLVEIGEAGEIFAVKIAGHTYRVCGDCLIKPHGGGIMTNEKK